MYIWIKISMNELGLTFISPHCLTARKSTVINNTCKIELTNSHVNRMMYRTVVTTRVGVRKNGFRIWAAVASNRSRT